MAVASRYTVALHILSVLAYAYGAQRSQSYLTSEFIAKSSVNTNPVFIRRILSSLAKAGLVQVRYGTGSGWCLKKQPNDISFLDVYDAVEQKSLFEYHHSDPNPNCPIGGNIQQSLKPYYEEVEQAMKLSLSKLTIASLLSDTLLQANFQANENIQTLS